MVNPAIAGRTYPATAPYLVGREKVREFADATQSSCPLSTDPEAARAAGYRDVVAPATFAVIISQRAEMELLFDPDADIDFAHLVHGEQKFEHLRPIQAGDELSATLTVQSVKSLGGNTMLTTVTRISDAEGDPVSVATASFVIRGAA
ncbi:MAG TPA: MaoC family dehydratase [Pseudoclavibacter sp.]|nr:MaoC family dehydratase [Pseudoclavibacter sp.]